MVRSLQDRWSSSPGKVAFIRLPPFIGFATHHPHDVTLPLTIAYSATMAKERGWDVTVLDIWSRPSTTMAEVIEKIRSVDPDVIVFEAHAPPFPAILKCAEAVRSFSDAKMLAFGSVPTFVPHRVVGPGLPFDVAMAGETEETTMALLDAFAQRRQVNDIEGIAIWDAASGRVHRTPERAPLEDLDTLPMIDYGLFDLERYCKYSFPMPLHRNVRWGHVLATRGCPYPCTHCSFDHRQTFGPRFRRHSPKRFVDNLELLVKRHGRNAISVEDDVFTLDRKYVAEVCDEIERRNLKVKWIVQTRVDCYDRELVRKMKRAGCVGFSLGIESGNDRMLKVLKKGFNRAKALEGIRICEEEGMMLRLLFIIGNPTETAPEVEDTIDLACRTKAITIQAHISTPYPGTGLLGKEGGDGEHITDFTSYNRVARNLSPIPDEQLWSLQKKFYHKYYFSWRYLKVFFSQRVRYLAGSWRRDLPLFLNAFWYLAWGSRRQAQRDVGAVFRDLPAPAAAPAHAHTHAPAHVVLTPVFSGEESEEAEQVEEAKAV